MRAHPQGVLPEGNRFLVSPAVAAAASRARLEGLGALAVLPDDLLLRLLGGGGDADDDDGVGAPALAALARCSRVLRAFASHEDLWKAAVLRAFGGDFAFEGDTWREAYAASLARRDERRVTSSRAATTRAGPTRTTRDDDAGDASTGNAPAPSSEPPPRASASASADLDLDPLVRRPPVFSDALFLRHLGAALDLDPAWTRRSTIPRVDVADLPPDRFHATFEASNAPVILTNACSSWPALDGRWSPDALVRRFGGDRSSNGKGESPPIFSNDEKTDPLLFSCGGYGCAMSDFWRYALRSRDDQPLYLFDRAFGSKAPELAREYDPPAHFSDDLFALLGEDRRPAYRWFIAGGARSGSSWHVDPNGTSAWNAVAHGRKRWMLFPPNRVPPGVHPSPDGAEVAQPVSLVEWYGSFYEHAYRGSGEETDSRETPSALGPLEGTCGPGDVLFVPSGWWHAALNLEPCVAVTQNFCSPRTLPRVLRFLRRAKRSSDAGLAAELVSGTRRADRAGLHDRFYDAVRASRPDALEEKEEGTATKRRRRENSASDGAGRRASANAAGLAGLFGRGGEEGPNPAAGADARAKEGSFAFGF